LLEADLRKVVILNKANNPASCLQRQNHENEWPVCHCEFYGQIREPALLKNRLQKQDRILTRIFRPKREEVTEEWRKLQDEELHNLYPSPNISKQSKSRRRWAVYVACTGEERKLYKVLVGKHERKRPLGRRRRRGEDWIRMDLR
jgi:hypothetical protein